MSAFFAKAIDTIKDGYLAVVDWVDTNPQKSVWIATALILLALFV